MKGQNTQVRGEAGRRLADHVLVIDDDAAVGRLVATQLRSAPGEGFEAEVVGRLSEGLARLEAGDLAAVVLDLGLPDVQGLEGLRLVRQMAPDVPVVVLSGNSDEDLALAAVAEGAQDYIVKGSVDGGAMARTVRHAIQRHNMLDAVRSLALVDDLTGLRNRRGLMVLAEHEMAMSERTGIGFCLVFLDVDGMKSINDRFGHAEGDKVLQDLAALMRSSFRESDVLARVGGDEFCVLLTECHDDETENTLIGRLIDAIAAANAADPRPYELRVSIGRERYNPGEPDSLDRLLDRADAAMYASRSARTRVPTVLVVDDDEDLRAMLELSLGDRYKVVSAPDGGEALVRCSQRPPDLVLIDLSMAGINGLEVVRRLRRLPSTRHLPIIMMTGESADTFELQGLRAGVDDFISKPFDLEVLTRRIDNALARGPSR